MSGPLALYTAEEMRAVDAAAIDELGIPGAVLMERAGLAAAQEIARLAVDGPGTAAVVCGAGNNGGDGFVVARHLQAAGWEVECFLAGDPRKLPPDARLNHDVAGRLGIPIRSDVRRARLTRADVVVDALLGTGFRGVPRGVVGRAIEAMRGPIGGMVALDVPSGVDGSTGVVAGAAVAADVTVGFHGRKLGTAIEPGRSASGRVVVADIGIPPGADRRTAAALLAGAETLAAAWPKSVRGSKYTAGAVLVVGGAPGLVGAPLMAALAALRGSAGIAWIAAPAEAVPALEGRVPEVMVRALPEALELLGRAGAVALGPGLGRSDDAVALARRIAAEHAGPMVIDADGLFAFNEVLARLRRRPGPTVLTPHEGEMARLLGVESGWVRENRLEAVRKAAAAGRCVVLLKGADTLVADPDGRLGVSHAGPPGLATAGSGDVLTGAIAAMLAKGCDAHTAACIAAEAHGLAGRRAVERRGPSGIIATDVIDALPEVLP
jgi:ADP-dependent NAD(P)H-hydrate dehydratase / NAD(P)H-hydrate epimerase